MVPGLFMRVNLRLMLEIISAQTSSGIRPRQQQTQQAYPNFGRKYLIKLTELELLTKITQEQKIRYVTMLEKQMLVGTACAKLRMHGGSVLSHV